MTWGKGLSRGIFALAVLAAGAAPSWATKLDKTACKGLSDQHLSVLATGVREDMERGPEWAKVNLEPARLANIKRLMEIEEQLEFRCGVSRTRILAKSPPPTRTVSRTDDKGPPPVTEKKTEPAAAAAPAGEPKTSAQPRKSAAVSTAPSPSKTASAKPPTTSAGRKTRREPSSAYVPPQDVMPFSLSRFGTTR